MAIFRNLGRDKKDIEAITCETISGGRTSDETHCVCLTLDVNTDNELNIAFTEKQAQTVIEGMKLVLDKLRFKDN